MRAVVVIPMYKKGFRCVTILLFRHLNVLD